MFLPKSKYKVSQAKPGEWSLNGEQYLGPIFTTFQGKTYAGESPMKNKGKLVPMEGSGQGSEKPVTGIKRIPTEQEYTAGVMERYFCQDRVTMKIVELLPEAYQRQKSDKGDTISQFASGSWILTGILDDLVIGNYALPGVRSKNWATIQKLEQIIPGISSSGVLSDPAQFVREYGKD